MENEDPQDHDRSERDLVEELTPVQIQILEGLVAGLSIKEACEAAGVDRSLYYRKCKGDPVFEAARNRREREEWRAEQARTRRLRGKAFDTIEALLDEGDEETACWVIEKTSPNEPPDIGPTDPEQIRLRKFMAETAKDEQALAALLQTVTHKLSRRHEQEGIEELLEALAASKGGDATLHKTVVEQLQKLQEKDPDADLPDPRNIPFRPRFSNADPEEIKERFQKLADGEWRVVEDDGGKGKGVPDQPEDSED